MKHRKSYPDLALPLAFAGLFAILVLLGQLMQKEREEQKIFCLEVELPGQNMSPELPSQMKELPGFLEGWTAVTADIQLQVGNYQAAVEVRGVDLASWPLKIIVSAGEQQGGTAPLLVVGEDFFKGFTDASGLLISERQAKILEEQMDSLEAQAALASCPEGESRTARFLGIAKGSGVYMDAGLLAEWLSASGEQAEISIVCLKIRGKTNADKARESLRNAGCSVAVSDSNF